jgi:hypothetical protein
MAEQELIKIEKNGNVLEVDERRFRIFYKGVGYKRVVENEEGEKLSMKSKKEEIVAELEKREIEHNPEDKKEDLLKLLEGE